MQVSVSVPSRKFHGHIGSCGREWLLMPRWVPSMSQTYRALCAAEGHFAHNRGPGHCRRACPACRIRPHHHGSPADGGSSAASGDGTDASTCSRGAEPGGPAGAGGSADAAIIDPMPYCRRDAGHCGATRAGTRHVPCDAVLPEPVLGPCCLSALHYVPIIVIS